MPERFEIYIVQKRRYINTLPFLFYTLSVKYTQHIVDDETTADNAEKYNVGEWHKLSAARTN